jgi:hypothetical protein
MTTRVSLDAAPREGMSIVRRHYGQLCAELYDLTKPVDGHYPEATPRPLRNAAI